MRPLITSPNFRYDELAARLREQIQSGALKVGERLPTLAAMHAEYGASRPTVEKAYALLADEGLIERAHGMSAVVAASRKRRVGTIGLCGSGFFGSGPSYYWSRILAGISSRTRPAGIQLLLLHSNVREEWEKVDGILLSGWNDVDYLPHIPAQMPVVSVVVPLPGKAGVWADEYGGARKATEHLLELGHRKIGFMHGPSDFMKERIRGWADALHSSGIKAQKAWLRETSGMDYQGTSYAEVGRRDMSQWFKSTSATSWQRLGCTALLCQNDAVAVGAMQALRELGVSVPREVSVVGFDGTDVCELVSPTLTTVAVPLQEMGAAAAELLLRQIEADNVTDEGRILSTQLQVRQSTAPSAMQITEL